LAKLSKKRVERAAQLDQANKTFAELQAELKALRKKAKACSGLSNHLMGFYDEISRLAKGRTLVEATSLVVEQANDIIRDAKQIVENDVYLDRIKEFVPAGNNPVYPDVLVVSRAVRQSLHRCGIALKRREERALDTLARARTVVGALECFLSDEENGEFGLKNDVARYVSGETDDSCFEWHEFEDGRELIFDFESLDSESVEEYIRKTEEDEDGENENATDVEDEEEEQEEEVEE
jgi:hypothetical protein